MSALPRTSRRAWRLVGSVFALAVGSTWALLAGCASTRGLQPSATLERPDHLAAREAFADAPVTAGAWPNPNWWRLLGDPQLDQLIEEGLRDSPSLKSTAARTRAALAAADIDAAARLPQAALSAEATDARFSANGIVPPPFAGGTTTFGNLQASLSWQLDFWGKQRSTVENALGLARATALDSQAARVALATAIAHVYIELQHEYLLLDVADATVMQREHLIALTRDRHDAGLDSRLEVSETEGAVPAARGKVIEIKERIERTRHELAALVGAGPDRGLRLDRPATAALTEPALPGRLPSELLGRRPDLIAQRARVDAAGAAIKVRQSDFYPNVDLVAFAGFQRLGPGALISAGERQLGVGPALDLPLFDGGARRARLAGADAAYDDAVEQYNQTLADALRDVADELSALRSVAAQRIEQRQAQGAASQAYDLAVLRYQEGVGNYLQVLATEDQLLTQRRLEADLRARRLDLTVGLIGALGGGFELPANALAAR